MLLLCSCAAQHSTPPALPPEITFNRATGLGDNLHITLHLENGEELLFAIDTGCPNTFLDHSLEPKLGKRLGTEQTTWGFSGQTTTGIYNAPKLFLGGTQLVTARQIRTDNVHQQFPGQPVMGILGMDCLRHYCIQFDFAARKLRFLDPDHLQADQLGTPFQLASLPLLFGGVYINANLGPMKNIWMRPDTGCIDPDFVLTDDHYRNILEDPKPLSTGRWEMPGNQGIALSTRINCDNQIRDNLIFLAKGVFAGRPTDCAVFSISQFADQTYTKLLFFKNPGVTWPAENAIGLRFLARNLVTFNFPKRVMYLKRQNTGLLVDSDNFVDPHVKTIFPDAENSQSK